MVTLLVVHVVATAVLAVVLLVVIAAQAAARALRSASARLSPVRVEATAPEAAVRLHVGSPVLTEADELLLTRELQPR